MEYRKFGKLDFMPSALGFGCMRLPTLDGTMATPIDEKETVRVIRHAIDCGVNYIDTAYPYHGGASEGVVGKALADGYRDKIKLATKSPVWLIKEPGDFDTILDEQLKRLNTNNIDFYLLHSLSAATWEKCVLRHDLIKKALDAKKAGKINYIGFSFHDEYPAFETILNHFDWDFCQIQLNYLNEDFQAGLKGLHLAESKNTGVVIMEPLLGGKLAKQPTAVREMFRDSGFSPVQAALDYLWNMPGVSTILSGMSTMEQTVDNIKYAEMSKVGGMGERQIELIKKVVEYHKNTMEAHCTNCRYCMPCPSGVDIPVNISFYNEMKVYDDISVAKESRRHKAIFLGEQILSDNCTGCAVCEEKCPQHLKISEIMRDVTATLK